MDNEGASGDIGSFTIEVGLQFHKIIDYDRKAMRQALVKGGAEVRKEARRILSRRAISMAGEFPGQQTGALKRSIGVVSKGTGGGWVKIGPRSIPKSKFYPAFLFYGTRVRNSKGANIDARVWRKRTRYLSAATISTVSDQRLMPRGNFMTAALDTKRESVRGNIREALKNSLVPR